MKITQDELDTAIGYFQDRQYDTTILYLRNIVNERADCISYAILGAALRAQEQYDDAHKCYEIAWSLIADDDTLLSHVSFLAKEISMYSEHIGNLDVAAKYWDNAFFVLPSVDEGFINASLYLSFRVGGIPSAEADAVLILKTLRDAENLSQESREHLAAYTYAVLASLFVTKNDDGTYTFLDRSVSGVNRCKHYCGMAWSYIILIHGQGPLGDDAMIALKVLPPWRVANGRTDGEAIDINPVHMMDEISAKGMFGVTDLIPAYTGIFRIERQSESQPDLNFVSSPQTEQAKDFEEIKVIPQVANTESWADVYKRYNDLMQSGDTAKAKELLEDYSRWNPGNPGAAYSLGLCYEKEGGYAEAIEIYERLLVSNPKQIWAACRLVICFDEIGKGEECARMLDRMYEMSCDAEIMLQLDDKIRNEISRVDLAYGAQYKAGIFKKASDSRNDVASGMPASADTIADAPPKSNADAPPESNADADSGLSGIAERILRDKMPRFDFGKMRGDTIALIIAGALLFITVLCLLGGALIPAFVFFIPTLIVAFFGVRVYISEVMHHSLTEISRRYSADDIMTTLRQAFDEARSWKPVTGPGKLNMRYTKLGGLVSDPVLSATLRELDDNTWELDIWVSAIEESRGIPKRGGVAIKMREKCLESIARYV
jgi:tetratricopeptide (TPR) repeat protein